MRSAPPGAVHLVARYLSIVGHPFVAIPATVRALSALGAAEVRTAFVLGLVFMAVSAGILVGIQAGCFNDFDVSERERRPTFFAVLAVATLGMAFWVRADVGALRACLIASAVVGACGLLNCWTKVSLHTAFALYAAGLWAAWAVSAALVALPLVGAVAWSRVRLGRHSWREVGAGALIGSVGGALLAFYP